MKKKHRDITVNGVKYAWVCENYGYGYTVWKNRKHWFRVHLGSDTTVTPKMVATEIEKRLDE